MTGKEVRSSRFKVQSSKSEIPTSDVEHRTLDILAAIRRIVGELYAKDAKRYKPLFGAIGRLIKNCESRIANRGPKKSAVRHSPSDILLAVQALERKEASSRASFDPVKYLAGALRKIRGARRSSMVQGSKVQGVTAIGEILDSIKIENRVAR